MPMRLQEVSLQNKLHDAPNDIWMNSRYSFAALKASAIALKTTTVQRSNYSEPKLGLTGEQGDEDEAGPTKDRMRSTLSDKKRKSSVSVRRVLLYRKNFATLLEEAVRAILLSIPKIRSNLHQSRAASPLYVTAAAPPPSTPRRPFCSVCGYWGNYKCTKCGMHYCTIPCKSTHDDTRCEKRVL